MRFEDNHSESVVAEFKMLTQQGTVNDYLQKFEELRAQVLMRNPRVLEDFILECFIGGLKEEIRETVKMYEPINLSQVVSLSRKQERVINAKEEKTRWLNKGSVAPVGKKLIKGSSIGQKIQATLP